MLIGKSKEKLNIVFLIPLTNLKDSLDQWRREVKDKLEAVDALCFESADSISPEQYALLREKRNQLAIDYDTVVRAVEHLHGRLNVLASLLIEFSSKTSSLQSWMTHQTRVIGEIRERSAEPSRLNEARQDARRLLDEISQEEARLKAIGALLAKIEQEVDALYDTAPELTNRGIHSTEIRNTFHRVDDDFSALQKQCSDLLQFQNKIGALNSDLLDQSRKVDDWFTKIEDDLREVERNPDLNVEKKLAVDGNVHIDHADQASRRFVSALDGLNAHPEVSNRFESESEERRKRHSSLLDRMQQAFNRATAEKAANEGVRDAKRDEQSLRMDLDSRLSLSRDLENDLKKLAGPNAPPWVESTDSKLQDAILRLQRNSTELRGFRDNVNDALEGVIALDSLGSALCRTCDVMSVNLRSTTARNPQRLQEIASELASVDAQLSDMIRTADTVKGIPNVTETQAVDRMVSHFHYFRRVLVSGKVT
ncbi:unnamed protein product [Nippostrongylus brasiliensis]|uniref:GAR domain-containing protein n=1 Tax=Nippostrongylus brasiliensis TaxID=27835 RepID=A0A0N4Y259_NIPBR|nr:unnamed protein product [Nippostrongylus brasiliensis]